MKNSGKSAGGSHLIFLGRQPKKLAGRTTHTEEGPHVTSTGVAAALKCHGNRRQGNTMIAQGDTTG